MEFLVNDKLLTFTVLGRWFLRLGDYDFVCVILKDKLFFLIVDFDPMIRLVLSRLPVIRLVNFCEQLICTLNVVQGEIEPFGQIFAILFSQVDHVSGQKSVPDMLHIKMNLPPCFF